MKRRLLNLLTALSLLLCIAVCMLWVRSYRYHESLAWPWSSARHAYVLSTRGGLTYFYIRRAARTRTRPASAASESRRRSGTGRSPAPPSWASAYPTAGLPRASPSRTGSSFAPRLWAPACGGSGRAGRPAATESAIVFSAATTSARPRGGARSAALK